MARRLSADEDGLTELGRRWREVASAHERLIHAYMWDITRYRLKLGEDLQFGTLPTNFPAGGEKEKNAASD